MNKLRYRVIFNKALGVMMAVSELAKSHRPNTTNEVEAPINFESRFFNLNRLTWLTSLVFANVMWLSPANANIVADPNAAGNQKPIITQSANGTPQINIQTPSAAGVSRNKYSQFDVTEKGVILNNSRKPTQTEQGGWVDGNQWLATGEARIILNEVNSKNPSQLKGFVEVAGQKAQVIIANPAGITCEGCGFINSDRATMTTGTVNIVNGAVTGYQINDGKIVIQGKGLDSSRQDHTDLIARAVEVNSDVWANDLAVTTGQNQVDADNIKITKNNEQKNSNKPTIAIDVSDLGGMYAGKIRLVGTEEGVGVRNTGEIGASAGNMIVTADGKLINTGTINSKQNIIVTTTDHIENSGTLYADQNSNLATQMNVENTGVIVAKGNNDINALSLANTKTGLIAGGINEKGKRETQGDVTVNTSGKVTTQGEIIASDKISIEASHIDASESYFEADDINLTAHAGDIQTSASSLLADKNINIKAASALNNDKGIWVAKEAIHIDLAKSLNQNISAKNELRTVGPIGMSNQQGIIQAGSGLTIETHNYTLDNQQGMLASFGDLNFNTGDIINRTGQISSTNHINMTSFTLDNDNAGIIQSGGDLSIHTQGRLLSNIQSQLSSDQVGGILSSGTMSLNTGDINNTDGNIYAQSHINIHSNNINNFRGKITGLNSVEMLTGAVNNIEGIVQAKGIVSLDSQSNTLDNTEGFLFSADALTLKLGDLNNTSGTISSLGDLNAITSDVNNTNGLVQSDALILWKMEDADWQNHNGILMAQKNLILNANNLTNQTGEIYIGGNGQLILNHLDNTESGTITSQNNIEIKAKDIDNRKGIILTQNSLTFDNSGILNNDSGLLSSLGQLSIQTNVLKNIQGIIEAAEGLTLSADTLLNEGDILSFGDMSISLSQTLEQLGLIQANNHLSLNIIHGLINSGTIQAGSKFTLTAEQIDNQADGEISAGELRLQALDTVTNRGLIDGLLTQVEAAHAINNLGTGRIYGDYLAINTPYLNNRNENGIAATIAARERLDIGFHTLDNYEHSLIYSAGDMALGGDLNEQGFAIGQAYVLNNHSATIESAHDMYLSSQYINNINDHFSTDVVVVANKNIDPKLGGIYEYAFSNSGQRYNKATNSIREHNDEVLHLTVENIGSSDDYYRWLYDREIQETVITQSDPAKIVSGGNLVINATEVLNDKSQILAGKTFTLHSAVQKMIN